LCELFAQRKIRVRIEKELELIFWKGFDQ
jgi:hypothetical protein